MKAGEGKCEVGRKPEGPVCPWTSSWANSDQDQGWKWNSYNPGKCLGRNLLFLILP